MVRITDKISSETAKPGDKFRGVLAKPVIVNGRTLFDKGTDVAGQVVAVKPSGRLSSPGELQVVLTSISGGWFRSYPLSVQPIVIKGSAHTKSNVSKIGGGAAAGAVIGGIAGGGKGAAIGAGVGAGTGTVVAAATGKREAVIEPETMLVWISGSAPVAPERPRYVPTGNSYAEQRHSADADADREDDEREHQAKHHGRGHRDEDEDEDGGNRGRGNDHRYAFSGRDREVLQHCLSADNSNLPPGLAKRDRLPPGLEKHLQRDGTLPPGLQKRVQPLPDSCSVDLPPLPPYWARVMLGNKVILLDKAQRILDILEMPY